MKWVFAAIGAVLGCLVLLMASIGTSPTPREVAPTHSAADDQASVLQQSAGPNNLLTVDPPRTEIAQAPASISAPSAPVPETQAQFERRSLKELLDHFDGAPQASTDWVRFTPQQSCSMLMFKSVAAVMDAAGTSWKSPQDGVRRDAHEGGRWDHAFTYNNFEYRFRRGDFPVYDEYEALMIANVYRLEAWRSEQARSLTPALYPPADLPYPEDFMQRASQFAHGALVLRP